MNKFFFIIFVAFLTCCSKKHNHIDFVGIWKSTDGASIKLNKDGTCYLNELNQNYLMSGNFKVNKKITTIGRWELIEDSDQDKIIEGNTENIRIIYELIDRKGKGKVAFNIIKDVFFENKAPSIYIWIGDPDNNDKYLFEKEVDY